MIASRLGVQCYLVILHEVDPLDYTRLRVDKRWCMHFGGRCCTALTQSLRPQAKVGL